MDHRRDLDPFSPDSVDDPVVPVEEFPEIIETVFRNHSA